MSYDQGAAPTVTDPTVPGAAAPQRRRALGVVGIVLVVAGVIAVLAFAPLAHLTANHLPDSPPSVVPLVADPTATRSSAVREVPVGLPPAAHIHTVSDVLPYAVAALGESGARALMAVLESSSFLASSPVGYVTGHLGYPYRYPALDAVLDRAPGAQFASGATPLAAALIVLAGQPQGDTFGPAADAVQNASAAAYGVLDRARASGACAPQLDLLLLVTADQLTTSDIIASEEHRAEAACPHEPTPAWLVGQGQLRRVGVSLSKQVGPYPIAPLQKAVAVFEALQASYPADVGMLTGLGDAFLREGTHLRYSEPFAARQDFDSAIGEYDRAAQLGDGRDAVSGLARALVGLGEPAEAAGLVRRALTASTFPGPLLEDLVAAEEAAHDFAAAEAAARRLDRLGASAYPNATAVFPDPDEHSIDSLDDATLPFSFGADRLMSLNAVLVAPGGAGGSVQDLSFIPQYRDDLGITGSQPQCASWSWRRDAVLDGHAGDALQDWPTSFTDARPDHGACVSSDELKSIAELSAGQKPEQSVFNGVDVVDARQNLLRWAGNLPAAQRVAQQWEAATGDKSALPATRLGEIDFLMHRYDDAAAEFGVAARRAILLDSGSENLDAVQAELDRGAALMAAGRTGEGSALLRPLSQSATQYYAYQNSHGDPDDAIQDATVSYYADEQLADYEREAGDLHAAVEDYSTALSWTPQVQEGSGVRLEALENNAALADLALDQTSTAAGLENKALAADPMDPAFLMTAGFIADRAGDTAAAVRYDRGALASDPGAFPAANDLGVELTRQHQDGAAVTALRRAVGADPSYALGWFNLGVAESRLGPVRLLVSQGAFAKAYSLDPALKDRRQDMTIDAAVYRTALDLSKPLPPRWSFAELQRPEPVAAVGLLAVIGLGVGLARTSGRGGVPFAQQWLDPVSERLGSRPLLGRPRHPGWALAATGVTFLLADLHRPGSITQVVAYLLGVLVLGCAAVGARCALAGTWRVAATQRSWLPGIAFGIVTGAIGLPWAPLPVMAADADDRRVYAAAPLTLAALSLLLFVESAWLHTPISQSWAIAALIMSASTLLPVGPLDGAHLGKAGAVAGVGVVGGALLVGLGLV